MKNLVLIILAALLWSQTASAGVKSVSEDQFTLQYQYELPITPTMAYARFVAVSHWWLSSHTFSGDAKNLRIKVEPNGGLFERSANGLMVEHLRLVYAQPHQQLRFKGGLGPLQSQPVSGVMTVTFEALEQGTKMSIDYQVYGSAQFDYAQWAPIVDGVLQAQWQSYRSKL